MASISIESVTKVYPNGFEAVHGLDLQVDDGELMVVVGPSGCGKTTVLRMIAGLENISSGVIRIGDQVVNDVPSRDRDIAMVFQSYALYPQMNVAQNIGFALKMKKVPKAEIAKRVKSAANVLGYQIGSIASQVNSREDSVNASQWAGPSCVNRTSS